MPKTTTYDKTSNSEASITRSLASKRILFFVKKGEIFFAEHRHILLALQKLGAQITIAAQLPEKSRTKNDERRRLQLSGLQLSGLHGRSSLDSKVTQMDDGKSTSSKNATTNIAPNIPLYELPFSDLGINPLAELRALYYSARLLQHRRPHIVIAYTIKPIFYSALLRLLRVPIRSPFTRDGMRFRLIGFFTGVGRSFISPSLFHRVLVFSLCLLLRGATQLWVLNEHNRSLLRRKISSRADRILLSRDMGVDLTRFATEKNQERNRPSSSSNDSHKAAVRFLYLGRLLRAKGVGEYLEAARLLRQRSSKDSDELRLEFLLAGDGARGDLDRFPPRIIERAHKQGYVSWLGKGSSVQREDVAALLAEVDCLVLPSYYAEGLPRVILEAAAMRVPSIIARYGGWQSVVVSAPHPSPSKSSAKNSTSASASNTFASNVFASNVFTCACRDSEDLAKTMLRFASLSASQRRSMGHAARRFVESRFSQEHARDFYLSSLSRVAMEIGDSSDTPPSDSLVDFLNDSTALAGKRSGLQRSGLQRSGLD